MKIKLLLLTAGLALCTASLSSAQQDDDYQEQDFKLHRYNPGWVDARELESTLEALYGRVLDFEDRSVENLSLLADSIVIYETAENLKQILEALKTLDANLNEEWDDDDTTNRVDPELMVVRNFHPEHLDALEFYSLAAELYSREIRINDNWFANIRYAKDRGLLIYEELDKADALLERLAILDASQQIDQKNALVVMEYQPRFVSPQGLMEGIQSFRAMVLDSSQGSRSGAQNISLMHERGLIVIRDHAERAQQIMTTLERIDQPLPQTMLVCQVIQGSNKEPDESDIPADLEISAQLKQILPHKYYTVSGSGMLRAGVAAGNKLELFMDFSNNAPWQYQLEMSVGSFDAKEGSLSLAACELSMRSLNNDSRRNLFRTSTTIYRGEYAVLGVTGAEPLFLVVQLLPVRGH